jgi:hypothetical protein
VPIVSNSSPLIALARIERLDLVLVQTRRGVSALEGVRSDAWCDAPHGRSPAPSELKESQPRYALEVARVGCQHRIAEGEGCRTDQQISERSHDAAALLLGVQLAGQPGNVRRKRIHNDGRQKVLDERFAPRAPFWRVRTMNAVNEFNDAGSGESRLLVAGGIDDALEKRLHAVTATLGRDRDT